MFHSSSEEKLPNFEAPEKETLPVNSKPITRPKSPDAKVFLDKNLKEDMVFIPMCYQVKGIGMIIKISTMKMTWEFMIGKEKYIVSLEHTKFNGKRELFVNGQLLCEYQS